MTHETKAGLLVGLGFIVVFAIVLSQTGEQRPLGDGLPERVVQQDVEPTSDPIADSGEPAEPFLQYSPQPTPTVRPAPSSHLVEDPSAPPAVVEQDDPLRHLPAPSIFSTGGAMENDPWLSTSEASQDLVSADENSAVLIHATPRVAPPPVSVEPTERPTTPTVSPDPDQPAIPTSPDLEPPADRPPLKRYVVSKGDTLGRIAEIHYGSSRKEVLDALLKANNDQLKSVNMVRIGQQLVIPALPEDQFEPVSSVNVNTRAVAFTPPGLNAAQLEGRRRAPQAVATVDDAPALTKVRTYVVQPKDTLSSIAQDLMGSTVHWRDIAEANDNIDPKKIRPGMELKVPARRPQSSAHQPDQVEA